MAEGETVDGDEGQEVSSQKAGESAEAQQDVVRSSEGSAATTPSFDLNIANPTGNIPHVYSESTLGVNEQETIENMLLIADEGSLVDGYEGVNETIGS
ncbi:hypothetical protein A4A49_57544, partial [Nicotiana attenuata]